MATVFHIKKAFPKKLALARKKAGLSILELARLSSVSRQHIRDLELGNKIITLKTLCKLANALKTPMWKLIHFGVSRCAWE